LELEVTAKTTLRLPREVVKKLKRLALETDRSLQEVAIEALVPAEASESGTLILGVPLS
jgi:predicted transcriptional regulator